MLRLLELHLWLHLALTPLSESDGHIAESLRFRNAGFYTYLPGLAENPATPMRLVTVRGFPSIPSPQKAQTGNSGSKLRLLRVRCRLFEVPMQLPVGPLQQARDIPDQGSRSGGEVLLCVKRAIIISFAVVYIPTHIHVYVVCLHK